jgi:hypothetical protein
MMVKFELISFFSREVEYHIQSNTNSKTIVLNNAIIHRSTLTGNGIRGIRDNQKWLRLPEKHIPIHA